MSAQSSPLGTGLYFIDVLACLLFCLVLALVGARFGRESTVPLELPTLERSAGGGSELPGPSILVRSHAGGVEIHLDDEPVTLAELGARLRDARPDAVTVRSEETALSRVIAIAHGAGIADIRLAYRAGSSTEPAEESR